MFEFRISKLIPRRRTLGIVLASVVCAAAVASCRATHNPPLRFGPAATLSTPTSVGTAPMFAVSPSGNEAIAWVSAPNGGTDGRLYISVNGAPPVEIRDSLGPIEAHGESPPKLAYAPNGGLYAAYIVGKEEPGQRFPLSALRLVRSTDNGKSWSAPITVTDGNPFGSHSFHAMHIDDSGTIYVSWLGKPDAATTAEASKPASNGARQTASMGAMGAMGGMTGMAGMDHSASASWITRSTDGGTTWSPKVRVDQGEACPCCRTALATSRDGTLYMAWRHVYPGSVRDIVVARSADHGATWSDPVRVHVDDWKFDACPHAGPAIAVDSAGTLHIAWWTGKEGSAGVFYAQSKDGGKTFGPATAMGAAQFSQPAHVQLALARPDRVVVTWDDGTMQIPRVVARLSNDGGGHFAAPVFLSAAGRAASFPVLGISGDSVAIAWSETAANGGAAAASAPNADPKASKGLDAVGDAQVLVRRGAFK
jgi:hypothetical protein